MAPKLTILLASVLTELRLTVFRESYSPTTPVLPLLLLAPLLPLLPPVAGTRGLIVEVSWVEVFIGVDPEALLVGVNDPSRRDWGTLALKIRAEAETGGAIGEIVPLRAAVRLVEAEDMG